MSDLQGWTEESVDNAVAVIGMAGRFPGAANVDELWEVLAQGREAIEDLEDDDLLARGVPRSVLDEAQYVRRSASLSGIEDFDEEFFGLTPAAAAAMDPQHRLFLESCQHAFDDAGIATDSIHVPVGVFGSCPASSYYQYNILSHYDPRVALGSGMEMELVQSALSTDSNFFATRASHTFDLRGPSMSVQTGCSSALVSLHLAVQSLLSGECDMALAGGYSIRVPHRTGYLAEPGAMVSPDGVCRPFDADANGTIFGSGGGALLLRPLRAALEAGDHVRAVVRGSAINNDGALKMGFTAPSVDAQAEAVAEAIEVSGVVTSDVSYVEAHGTGTPIGDPIEMLALSKVFGASPREVPCSVGSIKANIGHLDLAAGIAGIIKVVLAMEHRTLPATPHFRSPNPELRLDPDLFEVVDRTRPWKHEGPLIAGVSSLGVGGTNAHVVLQEAPPLPERPSSTGPYTLVLSGRTPGAAAQAADDLARKLETRPDLDLGDVTHTLDTGRARYPHHLVTVASDTREAVERLRAPGGPLTRTASAPGGEPLVAFLMPGQGSQYGGMTAGLHSGEPVFRAALDGYLERFGDLLGTDLSAALWEGGDTERTDVAQALLFSTESALATLLGSRGVEPAFVAGHSIGEYAAAVVAGVMSEEDAVRAVAIRGTLMRDAAPGAMLSVGLPEERVAELVADGPLEIAAVNAVGSCVVAGAADQVAVLAERMEERGVDVRLLRTAHAFHTSAMDEAAREFGELMRGITLNPPRVPITSNVTGTWMSDEEATDPRRWGRQIRSTVRFADNAAALLERARGPMVECGPGRTLTGTLRASPRWSKDRHVVVQPVRHPSQDQADPERLLLALGQLRVAGVPVSAPEGERFSARRISLPGYPFQRRRRWIDSLYSQGHVHVASPADAALPAVPGPPDQSDQSGTASIERVLSEVWSDLLGLEEIDPGANFFDLGGDSMVAVQVASRVNRRGVDLSPRMIFDHPTITSLTSVLGPLPEQAVAGPAPRAAAPPVEEHGAADDVPIGPVMLTPAQRAIRAHSRPEAPRALLELGPGCDVQRLERILVDLVREHAALRLRVGEEADVWVGRIAEHDGGGAPAWIPLEVFPGGSAQSPGQARADAATRELAASVRPDHPWRTAILTLGGVPTHLAMAALPDVCDLVSMRHLQQEVLDRYEGRPRNVAPSGSVWAAWADGSTRLKGHHDLLGPVRWWSEHVTGDTRVLGEHLLLGHGVPGHSGEPERIATTLQAEAALALAGAADDPIPLVLAHLAAADGNEGPARLLVEILADGRPPGSGERSVGEYTIAFPLVLDAGVVEPRTESGRVARSLAAASAAGPRFALARHVYEPTRRALEHLPEGVVAVRALGDQGLTGSDDIRPADPERHSAVLSPAVSSAAVELRVYRLDGALHLDWWVDPSRADQLRVRDLARETRRALLRTALAASREAPSDEDPFRSLFPHAGLSADEAATLFDQIPERTTT